MVPSQTPETPLRPIRRRRHRSSVAAAVALTSWLLISATGHVSPATARSCQTVTIGTGSVSPGSGTTSTNFRFTVPVSDRTGTAPSWVRVRVNGTSTDLAPGGSDWKGGVTFSGIRSLPPGTWGYAFSVRAGGTTCTSTSVEPAAVVVIAPTSAEPTAKRTARPTAGPTAKATPKPSRKPTKATPKPSGKPGASKTPRPAGSVAAEPTPGATVVVPSHPVVTPRPSPSSPPHPPGGGTAGAGSGDGGSGSAPGIDAAVAFGPVTDPLVAWLVSTFGGVLLLLFLMRRGMGDPTA